MGEPYKDTKYLHSMSFKIGEYFVFMRCTVSVCDF